MYASPDLEVCVHECRVTAEDDLYVATLGAVSSLQVLDFSVLLTHEDAPEFRELDMAVHMLFLAGSRYSYPRSEEYALPHCSRALTTVLSVIETCRHSGIPA